ncbi:MAG: LptF/LptG family permease, partial [Bacteroidetes bacterium]|nr:LptF/LptG family permease [Bacteroidota bacterium]
EEKANELEKFKKNISQSVSIPFHFEPARMFELDEETVADTLQIFESRFAVINELPNPTTKVSSLNRAMSVLDKYRPELESLETNLSWRNTRIAEFMIEVHKKLSIPFACVIFVLVGAPIGMLTKRGNLGFAAIISSILLTIYFLAVIQGEKLADRQLISPFMGMWGINIFYLLIGIILILHVSSSIRITKLFQRNEKA